MLSQIYTDKRCITNTTVCPLVREIIYSLISWIISTYRQTNSGIAVTYLVFDHQEAIGGPYIVTKRACSYLYYNIYIIFDGIRMGTNRASLTARPGRVAQSVGHTTHKSGVLGSIPGLATYFRFSFRFFKKSSCQLLAKVCARSTG